MYHRRLVTPPLANGDERPILTRSAVQASTTQPEDEVGTVIRSVRPRLCAIALSALAVAPLTHLSAQKPPADSLKETTPEDYAAGLPGGGVLICGGISIWIMLFLMAYTTRSRIE